MESDKNVMPLRKPTTANSSPLKHQYVRRARHKHHANLCSRACLCDAVSVDIGPDPLAVLRPCNCTCGSGARRSRATGGRKNTAVLLTRPLSSWTRNRRLFFESEVRKLCVAVLNPLKNWYHYCIIWTYNHKNKKLSSGLLLLLFGEHPGQNHSSTGTASKGGVKHSIWYLQEKSRSVRKVCNTATTLIHCNTKLRQDLFKVFKILMKNVIIYKQT